MEENFYKDEFEVFLKEQADNHRMFPSDSLWRNIFTHLHSDEKWPALTVTAFAFLAAIIALSVYFSSGPNVFAYKGPDADKEKQEAAQKGFLALGSRETGTDWNSNNSKAKVDESKPSERKSSRVTPVSEASLINRPGQSPVIVSSKNVTVKSAIRNANPTTNLENGTLVLVTELPHEETSIPKETNTLNTIAAPENKAATEKETTAEKTDEYLKQHPDDVAAISANKNKLVNRFSFVVYITPSVSFRRLTEDQQSNSNSITAGPRAINYVADVNQIVRHAPGTGVEVGVGFGYSLTPKFKITSGFQFNVREYLIEAYSGQTEVTTIALRSDYGMDSVTRFSTYRTSNGNYPTQLVNRYYQVSIPVGLQWQILGTKNVGLNVAGSVQPTYTLNKNAYLISNDFKNYAESGGILRNWNVNTSVEAFLSVRSGNYKWQIGPQFRYQQLPTFSNKYPIKEHLVDYGVKIGVSKFIQ